MPEAVDIRLKIDFSSSSDSHADRSLALIGKGVRGPCGRHRGRMPGGISSDDCGKTFKKVVCCIRGRYVRVVQALKLD